MDRGILNDAIDALDVQLDQVYERIPMLLADGTRWKIMASDHTRIRITQIPGGRKTTYRFVKVDPRPMGNGRADRTEQRIDLTTLARHYRVDGTLVTKLPPKAALVKYRARLGRVKELLPDAAVLGAERKADRPDQATLRALAPDLVFVLRDYERLLDQVDEAKGVTS